MQISSDPPFKEGLARFTTDPSKPFILSRLNSTQQTFYLIYTQQYPANLLSDLFCGRYRRLSSLKSVQFSHFSSLFCSKKKKSEIHYYRETTIVKKNIYKEKYGCLIYSCWDKALLSQTNHSLMGMKRKNEMGYRLKPENLRSEFYLMFLSREIDIKLCQHYTKTL